MDAPGTTHHTVTYLSYKDTDATPWGFSSVQWTHFLEFTISLRVKCTSSVHDIRSGHLLPSSYLMRKNSRSRHAVGCLQVLTPGHAGIDKETSADYNAEFGYLWFSVHSNCGKYFLLYAMDLLRSFYYALEQQIQKEHDFIRISVHHMCIPFPQISLPNYEHFLRKWDSF